jgi:hypothetical protein
MDRYYRLIVYRWIDGHQSEKAFMIDCQYYRSKLKNLTDGSYHRWKWDQKYRSIVSIDTIGIDLSIYGRLCPAIPSWLSSDQHGWEGAAQWLWSLPLPLWVSAGLGSTEATVLSILSYQIVDNLMDGDNVKGVVSLIRAVRIVRGFAEAGASLHNTWLYLTTGGLPLQVPYKMLTEQHIARLSAALVSSWFVKFDWAIMFSFSISNE